MRNAIKAALFALMLALPPSVMVGLAVPNPLRSSFKDGPCNSKFFGWISSVDASCVGDGRDAGGGDFRLY